ncbi:MAG TPA: ATP-binding protein [Candidatus Paceibacterota bacterium]|nr:ATP-binding protein [Verrucomicrobiota bacterium]HSA09112.1 ATP-binding protein [Candidatus Paceibacterota bacterium]
MTPPPNTPLPELEERLRFETLIADLSSKFVNLPPGQVDHEIEDAQRRVCESLGLDLCTLWQVSADAPEVITLTHLYRPLGGPPVPERMNALEHFPWCLEEVRAGRIIALASLAEAPAEAARDLKSWRHYGTKSSLTIPLSAGGGPTLGALSFNTVREESPWPEEIVKRLQLVAQIFANALARKRYDQALLESEEQLRMSLDAAGMGAWSMDRQSRQVWASGSERALFGFSRDVLLTQESFLEVIHPEERESVRGAVENTLRTETPLFVEYRIVLPDGEVRWIRARGQLSHGGKRDQGRLMGVSVDITTAKRAEEALRETQTTLNEIIDSTGDLIWSVDPVSFGLMTFNRGLRDYFLQGRGIRIEPGMRPQELFPAGEYVERWRAFYQRAIQQGPFTIEYLTYTHTRTLLLSFSVLRRDGKIFGVSAFGKDITELKNAAREAQELRSSLARSGRVTLLGQLASALAHELSQPLGAILRNAEAAELMLGMPSPDWEELRAIVKDIRTDDQRAGQVIDRLRSLLKRRSLDLQPVALDDVIAEVLSLVQSDAAARRVKLGYFAAPGLPSTRGDRIHLQQVLLNLLLNAMDALGEAATKEPRVQVAVGRAGDGGVEVRVCDNGPGIPGELLERLFEPFFTTKTNGMGIGLPVSKTIIEAHQGRIWAENRPEGGACFCFTLPVNSGEAQGAKSDKRLTAR